MMKIHHIGYIVKKIEKAILAFEDLGYVKKDDTIFDEYRQIDICFMEKDGYCVELVSPVNKESSVFGLLKKLGNSAYHICYSCPNLEDTIEKFTRGGGIFSGSSRMKRLPLETTEFVSW